MGVKTLMNEISDNTCLKCGSSKIILKEDKFYCKSCNLVFFEFEAKN